MSHNITTAFVDQFNSQIEMLAQQMNHRFAGTVRTETLRGKRAAYEQIGSVEARAVTTRHGASVPMDTPHERRWVNGKSYEVIDWIDEDDEIALLIDPAAGYMRTFAAAMNRQKDRVIISAATGSAITGEDGDTTTSFDTDFDVAVTEGATTSSNKGLNLAKLIEAKSLLNKAEAYPGEPKYIAVTQQQIDDLLNDVDEVSNSDYAAVKALVAGDISYFMGFNFIRTELLSLNSSTDVRTCFAWCQSAILFADGKGITSHMDILPEHRHATQVRVTMHCGATRMQEEGVVRIYCDESP